METLVWLVSPLYIYIHFQSLNSCFLMLKSLWPIHWLTFTWRSIPDVVRVQATNSMALPVWKRKERCWILGWGCFWHQRTRSKEPARVGDRTKKNLQNWRRKLGSKVGDGSNLFEYKNVICFRWSTEFDRRSRPTPPGETVNLKKSGHPFWLPR